LAFFYDLCAEGIAHGTQFVLANQAPAFSRDLHGFSNDDTRVPTRGWTPMLISKFLTDARGNDISCEKSANPQPPILCLM